MRSEIRIITPDAATELLTHLAPRQRVLNKSRVKALAREITNGRWVLSHQGIAIDTDGNLADGQHRLAAIVLAGIPVPVPVTYGVDPAAYLVIDQGKNRTSADIFGVSSFVMEVVRLGAAVMSGSSGKLSQADILAWLPVLLPGAQALKDRSGTTAKVLSSATVRLGAVVRMLEGEDPEYVLSLYGNLVNYNFEALPPIGMSLVKQVATGVTSTAAASKYTLLGKAINVFTKTNADTAKVHIKNSTLYVERTRQVLIAEKSKQEAA